MKKSTGIFFLVAGIGALSGCSRSESEPSKISQAVLGPDTVCDLHLDEVPALRAQYAGFILSSTGPNEIDSAMTTFSRIPKAYLDFVMPESRTQIYLTGQCQGGLTSWSFDGATRLPTSISSGTYTPGVGCDRTDTLAHEMGHAAFGKVQKLHSDFDQALDAQYNETVMQGVESQYLASYARTNREEFFAEIFDQFYCSAEARNRFRQVMPHTYAFAQRYLLAPR